MTKKSLTLVVVAGAALLASCGQQAASPTLTAEAENVKAGRSAPMRRLFGMKSRRRKDVKTKNSLA
jgi:hypothetical protein